ncbi:flagellar basal body rod protein FlgF [Motiliproteus coralliicola]|uniref:Flagellar basal-body rod protein FlgF n=1 Tax=Motiliproteus coralliicola TaxID=2283196 RepID=A0A369WK22_9GAMM|nr:flagellar basal body rod protein FlgF [Motiliproteus coralliicola]RDE22390.1 flagellar basal body rod protein FlgF [Motiliproteus coralliicola]
MDKLLFLSMTGANQTMLAQTAHANNLANVNTTGFKADLAQARAMPVIGEGYRSRVYAMTERPATNLSEGVNEHTGRELDVAVQTPGWIAVRGRDGSEAYTRAGALHVDAAGRLLDGRGLPVLGEGGEIVLPPSSKVEVGEDGTITVRATGDQPNALAVVDRIKLVNPDPQALTKGEDGLMRLKAGGQAGLDPEVRVASGFLETSNVNAVHELTSIIDLSRRFEMNVKMMRDAEENAEAAARILQNLG